MVALRLELMVIRLKSALALFDCGEAKSRFLHG
jgi:hypothetical protein